MVSSGAGCGFGLFVESQRFLLYSYGSVSVTLSRPTAQNCGTHELVSLPPAVEKAANCFFPTQASWPQDATSAVQGFMTDPGFPGVAQSEQHFGTSTIPT